MKTDAIYIFCNLDDINLIYIFDDVLDEVISFKDVNKWKG